MEGGVKVCVCSICSLYFSSKAKRPRCPRCGGWGRVVEQAADAAGAAERVRLLQAGGVNAGMVKTQNPERKIKGRGMSKLKAFVERFGGIVPEEKLGEEFDEEWLRRTLEELEERGLVVRVGGKLVFKEV